MKRVSSCFPVKNPYQFCICDTTDSSFAPYEHGGVCKQVKSHVTMSFVSAVLQNTIHKKIASSSELNTNMLVFLLVGLTF